VTTKLLMHRKLQLRITLSAQPQHEDLACATLPRSATEPQENSP